MTNMLVRYAIGCGITLTALSGSLAFAQGPAPIPQTNWTLHAVDSQELDVCCHAATNAFDGDPDSFWATQWSSAAPSPPHEIQIDLGAVYDVSGFRYLPRQDGHSHGTIGVYQFYVSMDGATWGSAVASGTFPNSAAEQQVLFAGRAGRYVRLRGMSEVIGRPYTTVAELNVLGTGGEPAPPPISQENWTLHAVDSQETEAVNNAAINAFDGDPNSVWATQWFSAAPSPPHEIQIDLGAVYDVSGFRYLPRQDGHSHGTIGAYQFYVSMDGATWGAAVASGTFPNSAAEQQVLFAAKSGRYVRLRGMSEVLGRPWTTVAELNVLGTGEGAPTDDGNRSPIVSLATVGQGPYVAPASIALRASAHDQDGWVTNVDFYAGSTFFAREMSAPYDAVVANLGVGTYTFVAVASDNSGNTGVSNTVTLTVGVGAGNPQLPRRAVFTPSADHNTLVDNYVLRIFRTGSLNVPIATLDLGKPAIVNGECQADISSLIAALSPGTYVGTVTAVGSGGTATSAPSPPFNR